MKHKLLFAGLLLIGISFLILPKFYQSLFPKDRVVEIQKPFIREVEKIVYKEQKMDEITVEKEGDDYFIALPKGGWNVGGVHRNGKEVVRIQKA